MGQTQTKTDPLRAFAAGAFTTADRRPVPLISTEIEIDIEGGLVIVSTRRVFRNVEEESIEATITFPVPVHATLFELEAKIGDRLVKARAQGRYEARTTYEDAVTRGKASVLHEEVLRGVHMLSVANISPGSEISVSSTWVSALNYIGNRGQIRIPLSVGDIYGRTPLADSDDLLTGGPAQQAEIIIRCETGSAHILSANLIDGRTKVPTNRPIDLFVEDAARAALSAKAADGREVHVNIMSEANSTASLNVAVIVDHSGSMETLCRGESEVLTKHQAVVSGLTALAHKLGRGDVVELWEFSSNFNRVGSVADKPDESDSPAQNCAQMLYMISKLSAPAGGTEIGKALAGVIRSSSASDILLITDGNSHALDIQELSRMGRRITVILIGEDSLEANVGALAAQTGGAIFVASDADIEIILEAATNSLRVPFELPNRIEKQPTQISILRGGTRITASWHNSDLTIDQSMLGRAIAAFAASLAMPVMDEYEATLLAEQEGFVSHLTSLVLIDECGEAVDGIPATRRIALSDMNSMSLASPPDSLMACMADIDMPAFHRRNRFSETLSESRSFVTETPRMQMRKATSLFQRISSQLSVSRISLMDIARTIDWSAAPSKLVDGDLTGLTSETIEFIEHIAARREVIEVASSRNIDPIVLIIGAMAWSQAFRDRSADRISRAIFLNQTDAALLRLFGQLDLV